MNEQESLNVTNILDNHLKNLFEYKITVEKLQSKLEFLNTHTEINKTVISTWKFNVLKLKTKLKHIEYYQDYYEKQLNDTKSNIKNFKTILENLENKIKTFKNDNPNLQIPFNYKLKPSDLNGNNLEIKNDYYTFAIINTSNCILNNENNTTTNITLSGIKNLEPPFHYNLTTNFPLYFKKLSHNGIGFLSYKYIIKNTIINTKTKEIEKFDTQENNMLNLKLLSNIDDNNHENKLIFQNEVTYTNAYASKFTSGNLIYDITNKEFIILWNEEISMDDQLTLHWSNSNEEYLLLSNSLLISKTDKYFYSSTIHDYKNIAEISFINCFNDTIFSYVFDFNKLKPNKLNISNSHLINTEAIIHNNNITYNENNDQNNFYYIIIKTNINDNIFFLQQNKIKNYPVL